jgi:peptide/nickel transport system substrate-binding protein
MEHKRGAEIDRRSLLLGAAGLGLTAGWLAAEAPAAAETPKRGGQLRIAILGGGSSDMLDANSNFTQPDAARVIGLHQPLRTVRAGGRIENVLAESVEANADATQWTIRLKKGVTFHNGKSLKAEDLAFTFRRITDPASPLVGAPELGSLDRDSMKVMDDLTLRVTMKEPYAVFDEAVADPLWLGIVPVGYDPKKPIGTGAFKLDSFTPGQQSVMSRYDGYWGAPAPLDSVVIIDSFASDTAAYNALQGGEIDIFAAAPLALAKQVKEGGPIKLLASEIGQWAPFTMRVDQPPFDNPDVRKAFRLLVDREQIVKVAFSGYAVPGNDVFSRFDDAPKLFQRKRDVEQAKALLKKAGHENLAVELVTADIANGVTLSAQIFARQAKDAGVTVTIKQVTSDVFFGDQYLKWTFAQDFWTIRPYLSQIALSMLPGSPYNETHWSDPAYIKLYKQALATLDAGKRAELIKQLQTIDFEQGGYIIPAHNKIIDLMAHNVQGVSPGALFAMGDYDYTKIWLS